MTNSIAFWRKTRGMTQTDVEAKTGIDQSVLSEIEKGIRTPDSYLERLASILFVTPMQLMEPPPLTMGVEGEVIIDRTDGRPAPGDLGEDAKNGKKSRVRKPIGRVFFLTPSQARVGLQLGESMEMGEGNWKTIRASLEIPCEPEEQAIIMAKAECASLVRQFLTEEVQRIEAEYTELFKQGSQEFYDGSESSIPEGDAADREGLSRSNEAGDGSAG